VLDFIALKMKKEEKKRKEKRVEILSLQRDEKWGFQGANVMTYGS